MLKTLCPQKAYTIYELYLFGCSMVKWKWWCHFLMQFLAFVIVWRKNKRYFLESWAKKLDKIGISSRKIQISKFDLTWHAHDLSWGEIRKWMPPSTSASQLTHKTCVARHSFSIFIWWPYLTWPWTFLSIRTILTYMLPPSSLAKPFGNVWVHSFSQSRLGSR